MTSSQASIADQAERNRQEMIRVLQAGEDGARRAGRLLGQWIAGHHMVETDNYGQEDLAAQRDQLSVEINQMDEQELDLVRQLVVLIKDRRDS